MSSSKSNTFRCAKIIPSFVAIFLFFVTKPALTTPEQDLYRSICRRTPDPQFCYTFFIQNVFAGATPESLSELAIRKSLDNATSIEVFIGRLINNSPKPQQDIYRICQVCFNAITNQFVDASFDFSHRDYQAAADDVGKTRRPVNDCRSNANHSPELIRMSFDMKRLVDTTLATISLLN